MLKTASRPRATFDSFLVGCSVVASLSLAVAGCDAGESSDEDAAGGTGSVPMPSAGAPPAGAGAPGGGPGPVGPGSFGTPMQMGSGQTTGQYQKADVSRNGVNYYFMANGWGPGFQSHSISWLGTSFTVESMQGMQGPQYQPATYPTIFCGVYSDSRSGECGLPRLTSEITSIKTGWSWAPNGNTGQYNAAYDIWLGDGNDITGHKSFLMVWYRDPPGQQPAGQLRTSGVTVANVPGTWNIWVGKVGGKDCISYVKPDNQDIYSLEFDVMDFVRDTSTRSISLPGNTVLSVAVGFEIWNGPVTNLVSQDFYVDVK